MRLHGCHMARAPRLRSGSPPRRCRCRCPAQQTLDRTKVPPAGKPPVLRVPTWTRATLANGAELMVSEKHDLPLVSFSITFLGGADQFEKADRRGVAALTAAMMSEGTKTRDGEALSNALQLLGGTSRPASAASPARSAFVSTAGKFPQTLDILADMLLNSTFPADSLERLRAQRLVALTQARAQPGSIAARVFPRVLYGGAHPFGQAVTEESLEGDHPRRHRGVPPGLFPPRPRAHLGRGRRPGGGGPGDGGEGARRRGRPAATSRRSPTPRRRHRRATTIYLVDKPGAAQSTFALGIPGPAAQHARLLRAAGHEHDPGRAVPVAAERQHPRGEGLQLRRQLEFRVSARAPARFAPAATSSPPRATPRWSSS